ncbi:MAG: DUF559 domain-containing protein [Propionibacteriaceae bacterium]|nr:DUF559 domain-containing protein [Propionibacteriaceae bacterium]
MIDIDALLARNKGIIVARDHRGLKSSLSRWVQQGKLARIMRGVYAHPQAGADGRIQAVLATVPGAVIADQTALSVHKMSDKPIQTVQVCVPRHRKNQPGFQFIERTIPRERARFGIMDPVVAAVDLADDNPFWLDDLARQHKAGLADYEQVLREFPCRAGNRTRRRRIARTSTSPWSIAERDYHDLFDAHGIKGWVANQMIRVGHRDFAPDLAFEDCKLAIEIDGRAYHGADRFEADRIRDAELMKAGWMVLHLTWDMLSRPDWVIETVTTILAQRRREMRRRS